MAKSRPIFTVLLLLTLALFSRVQALTVPLSAQNATELENYLLDAVRERAIAAGYAYLSTLTEASAKETGPMWIQEATVLERIENYLGSGAKFFYLQAVLGAKGSSSP